MASVKTEKKPTKRTAYHHGDLRRALIDAGLKILEQDGIDALSLRQVARTIGVSQAAPYAHFKDKHAILEAIAKEGFGLLLDYMHRWGDKAKDDPSKLTAYGVAYVSFAVDHPALFKLMFGSELSAGETLDFSATTSDAYELILTTSKRLLGDAGADDEKVGLHAMYAWSSVHGLANLLVDGRLDSQLAAAGNDPAVLTERMLVSTPPIVGPLK